MIPDIAPAYPASRAPRPTREALITSGLPALYGVCARVKSRLPRTDWGDLVSWGADGLLAASGSYDTSRGTPFPVYACVRIEHAIYDGIRSELGQVFASAQEAKRMADNRTPEEALSRAETLRVVRTAVARLPEKERAIVAGADLGERTAGSVAAELGVTKGWASRLRAQAIERLRRELREVMF